MSFSPAGFNPEKCRACCEEFIAHREACKKTPQGIETKDFPRRDCEDPDCALYDTMLRRMQEVGHHGLARHLRNLREKIMRKPRKQRAQRTLPMEGA